MEQIPLNILIDHISTTLNPIYKDKIVAKRHAWWMIESLFKKKQAELLTQETLTISSTEKKSLDEWIFRITEHDEPIQYILGTVPFGNLMLDVEHPILIPRPETEEWVHNFIEDCKNKGLDKKSFSILDIGTGSGCIAITLAHYLPLATVIAVDNNPLAITLAKKNVKKHGLTNIHIVESDLFNNIPSDIQFDVIVSNPPYISIEDFLTLEPSITAWEDCNALVAEDDGFLYLETIAKQAVDRLKKNADYHSLLPARLLLEIGHQQAEHMLAYLKELGFNEVSARKDSFGKDRIVAASLHI
jgi:release factor glutamine methyltransferase